MHFTIKITIEMLEKCVICSHSFHLLPWLGSSFSILRYVIVTYSKVYNLQVLPTFVHLLPRPGIAYEAKLPNYSYYGTIEIEAEN